MCDNINNQVKMNICMLYTICTTSYRECIFSYSGLVCHVLWYYLFLAFRTAGNSNLEVAMFCLFENGLEEHCESASVCSTFCACERRKTFTLSGLDLSRSDVRDRLPRFIFSMFDFLVGCKSSFSSSIQALVDVTPDVAVLFLLAADTDVLLSISESLSTVTVV